MFSVKPALPAATTPLDRPAPRSRFASGPRLARRFFPVLLVACSALVASARADDWAPNLTLSATWNDNATNANLDADQISALQTQADVIASDRYALGRDDSFHLGLHAAAEWWPRYRRLTSGAVGLRGEWQHKFGLGAFAPVLALEAGVDAVGAQDGGRDGTSTTGALSFRKRLNDRWRVSLAQDLSQHYARAAVYDRTGSQTTLELGFDATELTRFTLAAFHHEGDIVSYATPPRPELAALATNRGPSAIFNRNHVVYSIDARTIGARGSLIRALSDETAGILSYEYRESERAPFRYVNHLVTLALVHQF